MVIELEVQELELPISEGVTYPFWTFGGQVPGNFLRVREEDIIEFTSPTTPTAKCPTTSIYTP